MLSWELACKSELWEQLLLLVAIIANWTDEDVTHSQKHFQHDFVLLSIHSSCMPLRIFKEIWTNNAMRRNCTPHYHFCIMQRTLEKFMWVVWSLVVKILFIPITRHGSEPYLTSVMCSLYCEFYSPSPGIHCRTVVGSSCFFCWLSSGAMQTIHGK